MNYQSMEYFMSATTEGSFTAGARKLHITQQTLSAGIAHLEEELGCRLFERRTPLLLTKEGTIFYAYAEDFLNRYRTMTRQFSEMAAGDSGILRVGVGYTRGRSVMPQLIMAFQKDYPDFQVVLHEGSTDQLMEQLREGSVDLIIARLGEMDADIAFYPFYDEQVVLLIAGELLTEIYGEKTEDLLLRAEGGDFSWLKDCPFVMSFPEDTTGAIAHYFLRTNNLQPKVRAISDNLETLLSLCAQGSGAAFCPRNLMEVSLPEMIREKLYCFTLPDAASYPVRIGVRRQSRSWKVIDDFIRIAQSTQSL